jgi:small subunit ribosomal protein S16
MLMIRFQRIGRTNDPAFRIAVLEKTRAAKAGSIVEQVGTYNPRSKALTLNAESIKEWMAKGAQPTDSIRNLLISQKVIEGKKINVLPKKTPQKDEAAEAAAAKAAADAKAAQEAAAAATSAPAEEAPAEMPTEAEVTAEVASAEAQEPAEPVAEVATEVAPEATAETSPEAAA